MKYFAQPRHLKQKPVFLVSVAAVNLMEIFLNQSGFNQRTKTTRRQKIFHIFKNTFILTYILNMHNI